MFDVGFPELMLLAVLALLVLGPQRMPEAIRTLGLWLGRLKRSFTQIKTEIEREVGMDEVRRQLHNESILAELQRLEQDLQQQTHLPEPATRPTATTPTATETESLAAPRAADSTTPNPESSGSRQSGA